MPQQAVAAARAARSRAAADALEEEGGGDGQVFEELVTYTTTKLAVNTVLAPFEVASVLYQVQFQPLQRDPEGNVVDDERDPADDDDDDDEEAAKVENDGEDSERDSGTAADAQAGDRRRPEAGPLPATAHEPRPAERDAALSTLAVPAPGSGPPATRSRRAAPGYLCEKRVPSLPRLGGVYHGVRMVFQREGWTALWNGNLIQTWVDMSMLMVQPSLESVLNDALGLDDTTPFELLERRWPNLFTILVSHVATALILSPVQVLRVRLIVQKSSPQHAKYLGVRHGLTSLFREEGLAGWYRGLSATLLHAALVPFCQAIKPVLLVTVAGLRPDSIVYVLGEFLLTTAQLALTFPVQTAQRRLQAQWTPVVRRGRQDRPFDPAVRLSELRYTGVVDCIGRVAREEGIASLYRGFIYQWTGTVLVSLLSSFARLEEETDVEQSGDALARAGGPGRGR